MCFHYLGIVIDVTQQHGLIAERDAGVSEMAERVANFRR